MFGTSFGTLGKFGTCGTFLDPENNVPGLDRLGERKDPSRDMTALPQIQLLVESQLKLLGSGIRARCQEQGLQDLSRFNCTHLLCWKSRDLYCYNNSDC